MAAKKDMSDMQICSIIGNAGISILELNAMITELQGLADIALAANAAGRYSKCRTSNYSLDLG